ncbi:MAG: bifunctional diaminohydroxyphosphoribosylaminopyrimidine deaminase/5-amino-6-(5-phosphoribosylamino)uracil reductase RibD [Ginsengibacter sp.]
MTTDEQYISRCLQLAKLGAGYVAPNPMVGAVLVYEDKIVGEGYHQKYGGAHAEVNCINNVKEANKSIIEKSTLYVSLEPCSHYGKTPPCVDLIIKNKINKVVIGCKDVYYKVSGNGILRLKNAGVDVTTGVLEKKCIDLNKRFFTFHQKFRPYIILKWAQSVNGMIGLPNERTFISNEYSNRLVHKWRSEEAAILTGTNTALHDNPSLTTRLWQGKNPIRIVIDKELKLPSTLKIFDTVAKTVIYNNSKNLTEGNLVYIKIENGQVADQLLHSLFEMNVQSVIIEGGTKTLQSFIDGDLWDEARVITNQELVLENGIAAPIMKNFALEKQESYFNDLISYYKNNS